MRSLRIITFSISVQSFVCFWIVVLTKNREAYVDDRFGPTRCSLRLAV
jgi:hypothetical protein